VQQTAKKVCRTLKPQTLALDSKAQSD